MVDWGGGGGGAGWGRGVGGKSAFGAICHLQVFFLVFRSIKILGESGLKPSVELIVV